MRGNSFGKMISMTTFGESHGPALGVVVDGLPPGIAISVDDLVRELERRAPGRTPGTTTRREPDHPEILSGVFAGRSLGTPMCVIVRNADARSQDYAWAPTEARIGHADATTMAKFGIRDHRGGGRASGRETVARVIAGYLAGLVIPGVRVRAYCAHLGSEFATTLIPTHDEDLGPYAFPDRERWPEIERYLLDLQARGDSVGGTVRVLVDGLPSGLGEPVFDKLKADLAKALMSIGGVTSFGFGLGAEFAVLRGQDVARDRGAFGGIEGGISNGDPLRLSLTFKPPSTVGEKARQGRHDPSIIARAIPVVEAMVRFVIADHTLRQAAYGRAPSFAPLAESASSAAGRESGQPAAAVMREPPTPWCPAGDDEHGCRPSEN